MEAEIYMDLSLKHYPLRDYRSMWNEMNSIVRDYDKLGKRNKHAIEHAKLSKHMMHLVRLYLMAFDILEKEKSKIHTMGLLDTLEYLKKGGRISSTVAFIGGALAIKPVVAVSDGEIIMLGKARGSKNGSNFLIREIEKADGVDFSRPFCLGYTGLSDELLQKYIHDSEHLWKDYAKELPISTLGATIGTHVGPGAVAVAFFEH